MQTNTFNDSSTQDYFDYYGIMEGLNIDFSSNPRQPILPFSDGKDPEGPPYNGFQMESHHHNGKIHLIDISMSNRSIFSFKVSLTISYYTEKKTTCFNNIF